MILDFYRGPDLNLDIQSDKRSGEKTLNPAAENQKRQKLEAASYQPDDAVRARTKQVYRDFWYARLVQQEPFAELNDLSILIRQTKDQRVFNAWTPDVSPDPDLQWMSDAYSPIARNKVISIAAHITKATVFPQVVAMDNDSQEDKDAAEVMRDLMFFAAEQSDYAKTFLFAVIDALVLPAAIIHHEYAKTYRKQKTIQPDGTWKEEYVEDELFSGFRDTLLNADELFIADAFIDDIQKQPYLMWRRAVEYDVAYAKYHSTRLDEKGEVIPNNFDLYVRPGIQLLFDAQTVLFYRQYDENLRGRLVEEVHYWKRNEDLHLIFVNGVLITDPDQPNERKDKLYPFCKGGYEPFNHRFFWYSSLIKKIGKDEEVYNQLWRMFVDGTYLKIFKPIFVQGEESIDGSVVVPGAVVPLKSDTKITPYDTQSDLNNAAKAIDLFKGSIEESASSGELQGGDVATGQQTAQEVATAEENAKIILGLFAKMISFMVKDWGRLYMGDILQHMTVAQATEVLDNDTKLKFAKFLVHKSITGKKHSRHIIFDGDLPKKVSKLPKDSRNRPLDFELMQEEGHSIKNGELKDGDKEICYVDPDVFRKLKFSVTIRPEALTPPSELVQRAFNLEEYDRVIANPMANQEEALRTLLLGSYDSTRDNPDKFIQKNQPAPGQPGMDGQQSPTPKGIAGGMGNAQGVLGRAMASKKMGQNPMIAK